MEYIFESNDWRSGFVGSAQVLVSGDTLQLKDYSKTDRPWYFNAEEKRKRHETVFPQECRKAFEMGAALIKKNDK